jgi:ribosomal protein S16
VLAESSAPVKGKFIERLGWYNPYSKDIGLEKDRILNWLDKGAQPSNTASKLLKKHKMKHKLISVTTKALRQPKSQQTVAIASHEKPTQTDIAHQEVVPKVADVKESETIEIPKEDISK